MEFEPDYDKALYLPFPVCNICGVEIDEGESSICEDCSTSVEDGE